MPTARETVVYDVHDVKVYPLLSDDGASPTYGAAVDVPGIAEISMDPNLVTAELKGDGGKVIAKKGRVDRWNVSATYGKLALNVLSVLLGGDSPTDVTGEVYWDQSGGVRLPYFKMEAKIEDVDEGLGDLHVILFKCQITGGTLLGSSTDEFGQPSFEAEGIATTSTNKIARVRLLDAVTSLSA